MNLSLKHITFLFAGIFALILIFLLFIPPQIGMANSGDFGRIMDLFNLYYVPDYSNFKHFYDIFTFGRPDTGPHYNNYAATASIFIYISLIINQLVTLITTNNVFYIYSLSVVYSIFYCLGFYLLLDYYAKQIKNKYLFIGFSVLATIILADALFVEYFNSFFQEASYIVCILLFVICFLRFNKFWLDILLLTLVVFSKEQYLIYLIMLIPLFIKYRITLNKIILVIVFLSVPFYYYSEVNVYSKGMNNFSSIFSGLLHHQTPEQAVQTLQQIGLNPDYKVFADQGYWGVAGQLNSKPNPQQYYNLWQQAINDSNHYKALLGYILSPTKIFTNSIDYLTIVTQDGPFAPNLGNYKVDQDTKNRVSAFTLYSHLIKHLLVGLIINILLLIVILVAVKLKNIPCTTDKHNHDNKTTASKGTSKNQHKKCTPTIENCSYLSLLIALNVIGIIAIPIYIFATGYDEQVKHILDVYLIEGIAFLLGIVKLYTTYHSSSYKQ